MNTYKLTGTYKRQGAIGRAVSMIRIVRAETARQAMDTNRANLYSAGYDHILHKAVYIRIGRKWYAIDMMTALGMA